MGVFLDPNIDFLLKVNSRFHVTQLIEVPSMHGEVKPELHPLCVRWAQKFYLLQTASFWDGDDIQLFLTYGRVTKGKPISKQWISKWLVETIKYAYTAHDLDVPQGVKGHQTRKQAVSISEMAGVDPQLICQAATWASLSTFAKYYRLNLMAKARSDFGRSVEVGWLF